MGKDNSVTVDTEKTEILNAFFCAVPYRQSLLPDDCRYQQGLGRVGKPSIEDQQFRNA